MPDDHYHQKYERQIIGVLELHKKAMIRELRERGSPVARSWVWTKFSGDERFDGPVWPMQVSMDLPATFDDFTRVMRIKFAELRGSALLWFPDGRYVSTAPCMQLELPSGETARWLLRVLDDDELAWDLEDSPLGLRILPLPDGRLN